MIVQHNTVLEDTTFDKLSIGQAFYLEGAIFVKVFEQDKTNVVCLLNPHVPDEPVPYTAGLNHDTKVKPITAKVYFD